MARTRLQTVRLPRTLGRALAPCVEFAECAVRKERRLAIVSDAYASGHGSSRKAQPRKVQGMSRTSMIFVSFILGFATVVAGRAERARAQEGPPPPPDQLVPPPSPDVVVTPQPVEGQWLDTAEYGWVWVPAGTVTYAVGDMPCAYLYTRSYGWTWYASPWGWGRFTVGAWVARRSPYGYRAWAHGRSGWGWHRLPPAHFRFERGRGYPARAVPHPHHPHHPHHRHDYDGRGHYHGHHGRH